MSSISVWVVVAPNPFHDRQPIGGVRASPFHPGGKSFVRGVGGGGGGGLPHSLTWLAMHPLVTRGLAEPPKTAAAEVKQ